MTEEELNRITEQLFENFDFQKVRKVMEYLNWTWWFTDDEKDDRVPTVEEMQKFVIDLIKTCHRTGKREGKDEWYVTSGGFEVRYSNGYWALKFVVEKT